MPADVYERLREYPERSGERTPAEAVALLLDSAAGAAAAPAASQGSARTEPEPPPSASTRTETEIATASDSEAAAGDPEAVAAAPTSITQLPDAIRILSEILEHLGLQAAAAVRAVCRRWRDAAEAIRWRRLDVELFSERADQLAGLLIGAQGLDWSQLDSAARQAVTWSSAAGRSNGEDNARVGGRGQRIRVAPGASLRLEVTSATEDTTSLNEAWRSTLSLFTACSAAAGAASGGAGVLGEIDVDCSCAPDGGLSDLLDALVPPGAAARPSLRRLALRGCDSRHQSLSGASILLELVVDPHLRPLVFPNLESLSVEIYCGHMRMSSYSYSRLAAEALIRCFPNLKRLEFLYGGEHHDIGETAAAFGFPSLEYRGAIEGSRSFSAASLIERLASGPTAPSLKELVLNRHMRFSPELSLKALRALQRFPALERLNGYFLLVDFEEGLEEALAALGSLPALKSVGKLALELDAEDVTVLNGLAAALERSSSLTDLELRIVAWVVLLLLDPLWHHEAFCATDVAPPHREALPALARLAGAARGRLSLELVIDFDHAPGRLAEFAAALAAAPPRRLSLFVSGDEVEELECLSAFAGCSTGDIDVEVRLFDLKFRISPSAVFQLQVNTKCAEVLYGKLREWADLGPGTTLLDVCCGTGTIGLVMSRSEERVIGVDIVEEAIEDARSNAALNGIHNCSFMAGRAEKVLPGVVAGLPPGPVVAIVDPPRSGLHNDVIRALRGCPKVERVLYVSCSPSSFVNNSVNFCRPPSRGFPGTPFKPSRACGVDLFPHTAHCELVVELVRAEGRYSGRRRWGSEAPALEAGANAAANAAAEAAADGAEEADAGADAGAGAAEAEAGPAACE
eukprot:tig00020629_g12348.t1